ncbi:PKD domain-containing protein [Flavobacterium sp. LS1R49]|uniref:PKD domain-containing protein n=1 Tax=Flavobacterium shii TaxID=2987687 RepID=A0A9X2Z9T1_9FLAO|nr:PKD domain-containing protein [Flavobacterium shii]MCV9926986.1 PKD domain-containing protein [Flavobacterium shii]
MKKIHFIISLFVLATFIGCSNDSSDINLDGISAPKNISALTTVTQDNSGKVTFLPKGEGVTQYQINFGDGTTVSDYISAGGTVAHTYKEGVYQAKIIAMGISGKITEVTQTVTVSFLAPTNLQVALARVAGDNLSVSVSAKANFETFFQVYFGEVPNEVPVDFMEGETIKHTYANIGAYEVKVVALSGGTATTTYTETITISNPILLPIDFESTTLNYAFSNFGGAFTAVADNPSVDAGNVSAKVAKLTKSAGAEVWAGSLLELGAPIDFSTLKKIRIKTWSPKAGIVVKMKLENLTNPDINIEVDVTNTVANNWEELTFDFSAVDNVNKYQKVVLFFDFGNTGTGDDYYFDDIQLTSGAESLVLPLTFESTTLDYSYGNFGGATSVVIANPDKTGINTSSKVSALTKGNGAEVWAGSSLALDTPINFSTFKKIKMKVWSPQAGIIVKFKLENLTDPNINKEIDATTTVANGWEELTFDFAGIVNTNNYQRVVVFFDFGNSGTGKTYYFDDIKQSN